jgi:Patched family
VLTPASQTHANIIGLLVLDERRIQANRMDCCICIKAKTEPEENCEVGVVPRIPKSQRVPKKRLNERFMVWYVRQLMRPWVKFLVVVGFLAYTGFCCYTTSLLRQEFDFSDLLPEESYVKDFLFSIKSYTQRVLGVGIYFRDVDQLDPEVQQQMKNYVDELSELPQLIDKVPFCWFRDLEDFKDSSFAKGRGIENMTMSEQLDFAFSIPAIQETYGKHVVRDESGAITASRCFTYVNGVDLGVVKDQIQALQAQQAVTARQPINQGKKNWSFFTFDQIFFIWVRFSFFLSAAGLFHVFLCPLWMETAGIL